MLHLQQEGVTGSSFTILISHICVSSQCLQPARKVPDHLLAANRALGADCRLWGMEILQVEIQ